jgi:SAM-dependent methyltransferase
MIILKSIFKKVIPKRYLPQAKRIYLNLKRLWYFGYRFTCPCCNGHFRKFLPHGVVSRPNAQCPGCGSLERHRLLWLYLKERTNFFKDNLKVLDIAPMPSFKKKCIALPNIDYVGADISSPLADLKMDILNIPLPDNQFDCIICYHVLEHIPDDKKAIRELVRVLKPGGWAIIQSPVDANRDKTFEDPNAIPAEERERFLGGRGHVRIYGKDYKDRLEEAGFVVKVDNYVKHLGNSIIRKYSLMKDEDIYLCLKPLNKDATG